LTEETPANLELWSPWVRGYVFDVELHSRIGIRQDTSNTETLHVWHLEPATAATTPPTMIYKELATIARPPAASSIYQDQLKFLNEYADLRQDRASEILAQLGASATFVGSIAYLHPDRTKWTLELLGAAFRLANFVHMRVKQGLACRRPIEYSPQVQPMILTPAHSSFLSGHATEAFMASTVLWALLRDAAHPVYTATLCGEQLMRLASRIAINRTIAGVHFPVSSVAGALLGLTLGHYFVARCQKSAAGYTPWKFDGSLYPGGSDFDWRLLYDVATQQQTPSPVATPFVVKISGPVGLDNAWQSGLLYWLWGKAKAEWA